MVQDGAGRSKGKKLKAAKPEVQLTKEEKKEIRDSNNESNKVAKKCIAMMEPCLKVAGKAKALKTVPSDFEAKISAAKTMVRDAKKFVAALQDANKNHERLEFPHPLELITEVKQDLQNKADAAVQLNTLMKGFTSKDDAEAAFKALQEAASSDNKNED